ncbi:MAG: polysaccharide biosynthesis tyrosine autokinase [Actinomycetota bacterium]
MSARSFIAAIGRRGLLVVIPAVVAALVALISTLVSTETFTATSSVLVSDGEAATELVIASGSEVTLIARDVVGDGPTIDAQLADGGQVIEFTATSTNADTAASAANAVAAAYLATSDAGTLVDEATPGSAEPDRQLVRNVVLAAALGALIGLIAAAALVWFDPVIHSGRQLAKIANAPNLATIPRVPLSARGTSDVVVLTSPNSTESEGYRTLRTTLEFVMHDEGHTVIVVTSPRPGEGKSSVAANLAAAAATAGRKVVLIDGDLRKPQVHRRFRVANDHGLASVLTGESSMGDAVIRIDDQPNMAVMPSGPAPIDPADLLASDRLGKAIEALSEASDLVVIDAPPVLPVSDPIMLAGESDGVVLVGTAEISDRREWGRAVDQLHAADTTILGTSVLVPDSRVDEVPAYRYAPTARPDAWWVTRNEPAEPEPDEPHEPSAIETPTLWPTESNGTAPAIDEPTDAGDEGDPTEPPPEDLDPAGEAPVDDSDADDDVSAAER